MNNDRCHNWEHPPENGSRADIAKDVTRNTYVTHLNNDRMAKGKVVVVVGVRKTIGKCRRRGGERRSYLTRRTFYLSIGNKRCCRRRVEPKIIIINSHEDISA